MSKQKNGTGTIRQRKNGSWEGMYYFEGKRKSIYAKTESEVRIKLNKIYASILEESYVEASNDTLGNWLLIWLETYAEPTIRISTYVSYEGYIKNHIIPEIGHIKLKSLKTEILQKFFNDKFTNGRVDKKGGLSPKTLKNMRNMLNSALEQAVINDLIIKNPLIGVKLPKLVKKEIKILKKDQQERLTNIVVDSDDDNELGVIITIDSGVRIGELLGLRWVDIHIGDNSFRVENSLGRRKRPTKPLKDSFIVETGCKPDSKTVLILGETKTEKGKRTEYMTDRVKKAFIVLKERRDLYKSLYGESFNPYDFVFFNEKGNPIEPRTYEDLFDRCLKKAQVDKDSATFHSLRHSFATNILEKGCDIKTLSELLGHTQPSTSLNMYCHTRDELKRNAIKLLNVS